MSLYGEYGASKIGSTRIIQVPPTAWTEAVLTTLVQGSVQRKTAFIVKAAGTIYAAQANHSLKIGGAVLTLPVTPDLATTGSSPGYFELLASTPWRIDVEQASENSLWLYATATTIVRITELTQTPFDQV